MAGHISCIIQSRNPKTICVRAASIRHFYNNKRHEQMICRGDYLVDIQHLLSYNQAEQLRQISVWLWRASNEMSIYNVGKPGDAEYVRNRSQEYSRISRKLLERL